MRGNETSPRAEHYRGEQRENRENSSGKRITRRGRLREILACSTGVLFQAIKRYEIDRSIDRSIDVSQSRSDANYSQKLAAGVKTDRSI